MTTQVNKNPSFLFFLIKKRKKSTFLFSRFKKIHFLILFFRSLKNPLFPAVTHARLSEEMERLIGHIRALLAVFSPGISVARREEKGRGKGKEGKGRGKREGREEE